MSQSEGCCPTSLWSIECPICGKRPSRCHDSSIESLSLLFSTQVCEATRNSMKNRHLFIHGPTVASGSRQTSFSKPLLRVQPPRKGTHPYSKVSSLNHMPVTEAQVPSLSGTKPGSGAHGKIVQLNESLKVKYEKKKTTFLEKSQRILGAMTIPAKGLDILRALEVQGEGQAIHISSSSRQTDRRRPGTHPKAKAVAA